MFREMFLNEGAKVSSSKVQKFFKLAAKKLKAEDFSISELDTSKRTWTVTLTNVKILDSDLTLLFKNTESGKFGAPVLIGYKKDTEDFYPANRDITSIKDVVANRRLLINIKGVTKGKSALLSLKLDEINRPEEFEVDNILNDNDDLELVQQDGSSIQYIENPSLKTKLAAVKQDGLNIQFIKNPSLEVQLAAINQDGYAIKHIQNPSLEVQLAAIKRNGSSIQYIENPSEEIKLTAVKRNNNNIKYIKNPSLEVQLLAVKDNGQNIQFIKNPPEEVQLAAIRYFGYNIQYIKNPAEKVQLEAILNDGQNIQFIKNITLGVQLAAVEQNINVLKYTTPEFKKKYPEYFL